jgi:hypothetical protein
LNNLINATIADTANISFNTQNPLKTQKSMRKIIPIAKEIASIYLILQNNILFIFLDLNSHMISEEQTVTPRVPTILPIIYMIEAMI